MKHFVLRCLLCAFAAPLFAGDIAFTLMSPTSAAVAGAPARLDVVGINPGSREAPFEAEASLSGTIKQGSRSWPVTLQGANGFPIAVSPGGFAVRRYTYAVPAEASGSVVLEVTRHDGSVLRTAVDISTAPATPTAPAAAPAQTPIDLLVQGAPAASALARNFAGRFMPNLPIYFVYGSGTEQEGKFQFSFDYRLASMSLGEPGHETVATLRFGYTQRSLWDLGDNSSPFYDTSYMPEVVINTESPMPQSDQFFTWLGLRGGYQHESNGKAGTDSRSLNTFYVRPRFVLGSLNNWTMVVLPEAQVYVGDLHDNKNMKDYRGYGKLRLYIGRNDGPTLMASGWAGKDFDHGTYQLDLAIPFHTRWLNIESFFYAQYFNGYGESLRSYDQKSDALRVGLGLVR